MKVDSEFEPSGAQMLKISRTKTYLVPAVLRTLDILEVLHKNGYPLRSAQIAQLAQVSPSTTYRILRTLLERGYVSQNCNGGFSISKSIPPPAFLRQEAALSPLVQYAHPGAANLSSNEIIEFFSIFLNALREQSSRSSKKRVRSVDVAATG